jgi:hypothetical protein
VEKATATLYNEIDFETDYKLILERFISNTDKQHACPASLIKDQRAIAKKLADNLKLFPFGYLNCHNMVGYNCVVHYSVGNILVGHNVTRTQIQYILEPIFCFIQLTVLFYAFTVRCVKHTKPHHKRTVNVFVLD